MIRNLILPAPKVIHDIKHLVEEHFNVRDLERLHEHTPTEFVFDRTTDQSTRWHKLFYELTDSDAWNVAYTDFVDEVSDLFDEELVYQAKPTFRVALPDNVAVGEFHSDSDYMHGQNEINLWVPLTRAYNTAAVFIANKPKDRKRFTPMNCGFGQMIVFDGVNYIHGNVLNQESYTRVSFDFRVIPASLYEDSDRESINTKKKMAVGEGPGFYFARQEN